MGRVGAYFNSTTPTVAALKLDHPSTSGTTRIARA